MSRIDEALRRAGVPGRESTAVSVGSADVFVSPWMAGREPVPQEPAMPLAAKRLGEQASGEPRRSPELLRPSFGRDLIASWRERLAVSTDADPGLADQFRRLAALLLQTQRNGQFKTVMVTSAAPADGKTLTALNLAFVLSESYGRRVLLVDGDLRRPAIGAAIGLPTTAGGLSEAIKAPDDCKVPLVHLTDLLTLMPAGKPDPDPLSGLSSPRLQRLLQEASEQFDWVIVDTPPLGGAADASLICPLMDATLLVIRAGRTPYAAVQAAIETLGADRIFGVVLNAASPDVTPAYDGYYSTYSSSSPTL